MDVAKLEAADQVTRAAAREAIGKVSAAKRALKAAKKNVRSAKTELRKARKLLRQAKAEARRVEKQARKNKNKLSRALRNSKRVAARPQKDCKPPKPSPGTGGSRLPRSSGAVSSVDIAVPVAIERSAQMT
jgi:hypothetical protein